MSELTHLVLNSELPLLKDQYPLPLKPINTPSKVTPVVLSPQDVAKTLTTVSSLLVMVPKTDKTTSS